MTSKLFITAVSYLAFFLCLAGPGDASSLLRDNEWTCPLQNDSVDTIWTSGTTLVYVVLDAARDRINMERFFASIHRVTGLDKCIIYTSEADVLRTIIVGEKDILCEIKKPRLNHSERTQLESLWLNIYDVLEKETERSNYFLLHSGMRPFRHNGLMQQSDKKSESFSLYVHRLGKGTQLVTRSLTIAANNGRPLPTITLKDFPVALGSRMSQMLVTSVESGKSISFENIASRALSSGMRLQTLDTHMARHDWTRVFELCWGSMPKSIKECQTLMTVNEEPTFSSPSSAFSTLFTHDLPASNGSDGPSILKEEVSALKKLRTTVVGMSRENASPGRTLVVFVYHESGIEPASNLRFFLDHGLSAGNVDVKVVVNGDAQFAFPKHPNLEVIYRKNTCFDIGTWGGIVLQNRRKYRYFVVLNSSVRGPYLPAWWSSEDSGPWTSIFTSKLAGDIALSGLSVNCPDGLGRKHPHLMSMLLAFDGRALEVWSRKNVLACALNRTQSFAQESDLSFSLLEAGFNIESLQPKYKDVDWRNWLRKYEQTPLVTKHETFEGCELIDLDIFYRSGWDNGGIPQPYEYIFVKTNRGVYGSESDVNQTRFAYLAGHEVIPKRHPVQTSAPLACLLLSHDVRMDGAPLWLYRTSIILQHWGCLPKVLTKGDGPLVEKFRRLGTEVIVDDKQPPFVETPRAVWKKWFLRHLEQLHAYQGWRPDLIIFNTVLYFDLVSSLPLFSANMPAYALVVHEAELLEDDQTSDGYYYGLSFPELKSGVSTWLAANILWVSDSTRTPLSYMDYGQFTTIRGFVESCASSRSHLDQMRMEARKKLHIPPHALVLSSTGTICARKRQKMLLELQDALHSRGHSNVYTLFVGRTPDSEGSSPYEKEFLDMVGRSPLKEKILVVEATPNPNNFIAAADIHFSLSTHEAFPLNTLEAMCMRVPVIATPVYGQREQFLKPPSDGILLSDTHNFTELCDTTEYLLLHSKTRRRIGASGARTVEGSFSLEKTAPILKKYFSELLQAPVAPFANDKVCAVVPFSGAKAKSQTQKIRQTINSLLKQFGESTDIILVPSDQTDYSSVFPVLASYQGLAKARLITEDTSRLKNISRVLWRSQVTDAVVSRCSPDSHWLYLSDGTVFLHGRRPQKLNAKFDVILQRFSSGMSETRARKVERVQLDSGAISINLQRWKCEHKRLENICHDKLCSKRVIFDDLVRSGWKHKGDSFMLRSSFRAHQ